MTERNVRLTDRLGQWLITIVFVCLVIALAAALSGHAFPRQALLIQILLGGFIGGITNKIAITMLFERKWYLPGSGVLLQKHAEIVRSLARTVEKHLVNSDMLQAEVKKLLKPVNAEKAEHIMNSVIDEFRGDIRAYLLSQKVHDEVREALKTRLGFLGKFLHVTRIREYDEMAETIVRELVSRIETLRVSKEMVLRTVEKVGTLEDFLFNPNNELVHRHYRTDRSLVQLFFDGLDIENMVADKLATYAPSRVRDIIEENVRSHLLWLEIFGVILGMLFSGVLYFAAAALSIPL